MCGIAGLLDVRHRRVTSSQIEAMNTEQRHRGPDDWGGVLIHTDGYKPAAPWSEKREPPREPGNLGLGHVRLSILDLTEAGHQPMGSPDGQLWMVYNGEVYNYVELRQELEALGHAFRSKTDTEVVLAAYQQWGFDAFRRFNGMWGLAIWDARRRQLVCSRDRLGVKPFHYAEIDGYFAFASEIPPLLTVRGIRKLADARAVARFLSWADMLEPGRTYFPDIRQLPAGHYLVVEPSGSTRLTRWWRPPPRRHEASFHEAAERLRETFIDAVRLRLRSDVPVGVCLSGGVDSSAVACTMRHVQRGQPDFELRAFTARFPDAGFDESEYARVVAQSTGAQWYVVEPQSRDLQAGDLRKLIRAQAEPFPNLSMYAQYCLFRRMREVGVPVVLDGQGADELLWGYTWHYAFLLGHLARRARVRQFFKAWSAILGKNHLPSRARLLLALAYYSLPHARELRGRVSYDRVLTRQCRALAPVPPDRNLGTTQLAEHRHREVFVNPLPALLRYEDRNSMAFSVESRLPFLDYRVVELALSTDETELNQDGWSKALLREAMAGILPEQIRWRRSKLGFDAPSSRLFLDLAPLVREALHRPRLASLVRPRVILDALDRGAQLPSMASRAILAELWMREFDLSLDAPTPGASEREARLDGR